MPFWGTLKINLCSYVKITPSYMFSILGRFQEGQARTLLPIPDQIPIPMKTNKNNYFFHLLNNFICDKKNKYYII